MAADDRRVPSSLAGFRVVSELGRGGMGVVYEGFDPKLFRRVALKLLPEELAASPELRERFLREARAAAALSHPNIAAVHSVETCEDGRPLLVMELVDGRTLRDRIARGRLEPELARGVASGIAAALAKAHTVGIVHRDLKPENVMVGDEGHVKLLDFGIAKALDRGPSLHTSAEGLTSTGQVVGTAGYIAPEQIEGLEADQRVDVFAFGVVLFEILGGVLPWGSTTPAQRMVAVIRDAPSDLGALAPEAPLALRDLVGRCLSKKPSERPLDGSALVHELEKAWPRDAASERAPAPPIAFAPTESVAHRAPAGGAATTPAPGALAARGRRTPVYVLTLAALGGAMAWGYSRKGDDDAGPSPVAASGSAATAASIAPIAAAPSSSSAPRPAASSGISGRLPPEVIQTTLRQRFPAIGKCADSLVDRVVIRTVWFVIQRDGTTRDVGVVEMDHGAVEIDRCLVEKFSAIVFPKPEGGEVTVAYPIRFASDGAQIDAAACAATAECLEQGRCSVQNDECLVVSDRDCELSVLCAQEGACTADRGKCRARYTDCAPEGTACKRFGLCAEQDGFCVASSDADCERSRACASDGLCNAVGGSCRATSAESCKRSSGCVERGRCDLWSGGCKPSRDDHCTASKACVESGQCVARAGQCIAARDEDCRRSADCKRAGLCKSGGTRLCVAGSEADCRQSDSCAKRAECVLKGARCTEE